MVCTTTMYEWEQNKPTSDERINELIEAARDKTGDNWQVVERKHTIKKMFRKDIDIIEYDLMVEIGGMLPFQIFGCVNTASECKAYLYGLLSGIGKTYQ